MVLDDLHGKRHLPGELPLASLGPAHNPVAAAATPPTHTAAQAGPGAPWSRGGRESWWGVGTEGWGLATCVGENIIILGNIERSMNVKMDL